MLDGNLELERFEEAFHKLIQRHETLRTSFEMMNGEPVQRIHDEVEFAIEYQQATGDTAEEQVNLFVRPFDLSLAPLLRVGLIQLAPERHI